MNLGLLFFPTAPCSTATLHLKTQWLDRLGGVACNACTQPTPTEAALAQQPTGLRRRNKRHRNSKMWPHSRCEGLDNLLMTPRLWVRVYALTCYLFWNVFFSIFVSDLSQSRRWEPMGQRGSLLTVSVAKNSKRLKCLFKKKKNYTCNVSFSLLYHVWTNIQPFYQDLYFFSLFSIALHMTVWTWWLHDDTHTDWQVARNVQRAQRALWLCAAEKTRLNVKEEAEFTAFQSNCQSVCVHVCLRARKRVTSSLTCSSCKMSFSSPLSCHTPSTILKATGGKDKTKHLVTCESRLVPRRLPSCPPLSHWPIYEDKYTLCYDVNKDSCRRYFEICISAFPAKRANALILCK